MPLGTIQEMEERETGSGKTYYRIQIGDVWGSFWGSAEDLAEGDEVEYEKKDKEKGGNTYTNWTKMAIPQEKDSGKEGMEGKIDHVKGVEDAFDLKDREIIRQVCVKCAVEYVKVEQVQEKREIDTNSVLSAAEIFEEWILEGSVAKM